MPSLLPSYRLHLWRFFYLTKPAISVLSFLRNLAKGHQALFLLSSYSGNLVSGALAISFVLFQLGNINSLEGISAQQKNTLMCKQKGRFGTKYTQTGGRLLARTWRTYLEFHHFVFPLDKPNAAAIRKGLAYNIVMCFNLLPLIFWLNSFFSFLSSFFSEISVLSFISQPSPKNGFSSCAVPQCSGSIYAITLLGPPRVVVAHGMAGIACRRTDQGHSAFLIGATYAHQCDCKTSEMKQGKKSQVARNPSFGKSASWLARLTENGRPRITDGRAAAGDATQAFPIDREK